MHILLSDIHILSWFSNQNFCTKFDDVLEWLTSFLTKWDFESIFSAAFTLDFSFKGSIDDCRKNAALVVVYKWTILSEVAERSVHAFNKVNPLSEGLCRYKTNEHSLKLEYISVWITHVLFLQPLEVLCKMKG